MSIVELSEMISSYGQQGLAAFTVWISLVAGYLVAAYLAGRQLDTTQIFILNSTYLMISALVIFGVGGSFKVQAFYAIQIREIAPSSPHVMNYDVAIGITSVAILGLLFSLKFMRDIRHPKSG